MIHFIFIISLSLMVQAQGWKDFQLKTGCRLFNLKGELLKSFPGDVCLYFEDGKLLTAKDSGLDLYEKGFKHLWHIPGHFHHGLSLSNDKNKILAMASDFAPYKKHKKRIDKLMVISLDGKILHQVLSTEIFKLAGMKTHLRRSGTTDFEMSHFNSLFEIPTITKTELPYLKKGNFIANSRDDGLFILSSDLQTVEFSKVLTQSVLHQIHDAQILENGNLLVFNNLTVGPTQELEFSSVQEIDLTSNKVVSEFTTTPKAAFYSKHGGAVQKLDEDHLLISHSFTGTFIYSKSKKKFVNVISSTHLVDGKPFPTLKVRLYDLRRFLSFWE